MADENEGQVDLLGDPWTPPRDPRGRKRHKRDSQVAEMTSVLRASGMTVEQIAGRLGISEPTLRKYYFRELDDASALAQAVLFEIMWKKAREGNVSAARFVSEAFRRGDADQALQRVSERPTREAPVGLKQQRQEAALAIGGRFATPPAPGPKLN